MRRFLVVACGALAALGTPAAQTLVWEHVGDLPFNATRPTIAPDGTMWATGFEGTLTLPPPYGPGAHWSIRHNDYWDDPILALGSDTLVTRNNVGFYRSTDNGVRFFPSAFPDGPGLTDALYEIPGGLPHAGTLLGELFGNFAILSHDRGASWSRATIPNSDEEDPTAFALAFVRHGPHVGRVVAAGNWGLATSDDGGVSYTPVPERWEYFRYSAGAVGVLAQAAPGGGDRLVATIIDPQDPRFATFVLVSDDGGDTWRETFALTGDPNAAASEVVDIGGGRAVVVMNGGDVWASEDAGETWATVGVVPGALSDPSGSPSSGRAFWALRGPDGRLYVGGIRLGGASPGWTYRTVTPVVAGEPEPEWSDLLGVSVRPNPAGGHVEVVLNAAEAGVARVVVVDALGREVAVVIDGAVTQGERTLSVETGGWPAGVYVVRAAVGDQSVSARLVVAR